MNMQETLEHNDSKFVSVFETFGNICALNVLWILCSLPIVTIGASTTALYSVMLKIIKKEEGPIVRSFLGAFRENFKQATIAWLVMLLILVGIAGELVFAYALSFQGALAWLYVILGVCELMVVALVLPFLFPLIARYKNTLWNTYKNAVLLSVGNLGSWVKIVLAWCVPVFVSVAYPIVFFYTWYLWLILAFGVIAYGTSFTINKVFKRIERAQEGLAKQTSGNEQTEREQKDSGGDASGGKRKEARPTAFRMRSLVRQGAKGNIREHANMKTK
jgi:uncharacterized membrane protein YesL